MTQPTNVDDVRMPLTSADVLGERAERLKELFPEAFVEGQIDFDRLRNAFELFRRNITNPEILTFDELHQRARHIVEHGSAVADAYTPNEPEQEFSSLSFDGDDIPF